jgi:hypothetical protein
MADQAGGQMGADAPEVSLRRQRKVDTGRLGIVSYQTGVQAERWQISLTERGLERVCKV